MVHLTFVSHEQIFTVTLQAITFFVITIKSLWTTVMLLKTLASEKTASKLQLGIDFESRSKQSAHQWAHPAVPDLVCLWLAARCNHQVLRNLIIPGPDLSIAS